MWGMFVIGRTATTGPLVDYPHSFPSGRVTGTAVLSGSASRASRPGLPV